MQQTNFRVKWSVSRNSESLSICSRAFRPTLILAWVHSHCLLFRRPGPNWNHTPVCWSQQADTFWTRYSFAFTAATRATRKNFWGPLFALYFTGCAGHWQNKEKNCHRQRRLFTLFCLSTKKAKCSTDWVEWMQKSSHVRWVEWSRVCSEMKLLWRCIFFKWILGESFISACGGAG